MARAEAAASGPACTRTELKSRPKLDSKNARVSGSRGCPDRRRVLRTMGGADCGACPGIEVPASAAWPVPDNARFAAESASRSCGASGMPTRNTGSAGCRGFLAAASNGCGLEAENRERGVVMDSSRKGVQSCAQIAFFCLELYDFLRKIDRLDRLINPCAPGPDSG